MTLTNEERADRCQNAVDAYFDDHTYTNLVDLLADAMHWCQANGLSFQDVHDTALRHFEAETLGDHTLDDFTHDSTNERNRPC